MIESAWDEAKQQRLNELRARAEAGVLTSAEQTALESLLIMLDALAWQQLQPALARLQHKQAVTAALR